MVTYYDFHAAIEKLGWDIEKDDIALEIGGSSVYEIDGAGTKWAPVKGTVKYNKDAFIVIKNKSRNPYVPSQRSDSSDSDVSGSDTSNA
jgi:hypothetical protein